MAATSVVVLDRGNNTTCTINLHGKFFFYTFQLTIYVYTTHRLFIHYCVCVRVFECDSPKWCEQWSNSQKHDCFTTYLWIWTTCRVCCVFGHIHICTYLYEQEPVSAAGNTQDTSWYIYIYIQYVEHFINVYTCRLCFHNIYRQFTVYTRIALKLIHLYKSARSEYIFIRI